MAWARAAGSPAGTSRPRAPSPRRSAVPPDGRGHDGAARGHGFDESHGRAFVAGRVHHHVEVGIDGFEVLPPADEGDPCGQPQLRRLCVRARHAARRRRRSRSAPRGAAWLTCAAAARKPSMSLMGTRRPTTPISDLVRSRPAGRAQPRHGRGAARSARGRARGARRGSSRAAPLPSPPGRRAGRSDTVMATSVTRSRAVSSRRKSAVFSGPK